MGLTPLDGLMMGTRSGSIDPSIVEYVCKETKKTVEEVTNELNKKSGLLGICGKNDFRDVQELAENGNEDAKLALDMVVNSIVKYIAQYYFELNAEVDAIVFTAGAGENDIKLRHNIMKKLEKPMNIVLDEEANNNIAKFKDQKSGVITTADSKISAYVEPTDEEIVIVRDTYRLANK